MIGVQALSEDHYNQVIAVYCHQAWPGALLRFTVEDTFTDKELDTPLLSSISSKRKGKETDDWALKRFSRYPDDFNTCFPTVSPVSCASFSQRKLPTPPPVVYTLPVPPPPIIYPSPIVHTSQIPMDVDPAPSQRQPVAVPAHAFSPQYATNTSAPCCDVYQGKRDIHEAMSDFMDTLTRVMRTFDPNFMISAAQSVPAINAESAAVPPARDTATTDIGNDPTPPIPGAFTEHPPVHSGIMCDICGCTIRGIRHKCLDCPGMFLLCIIYLNLQLMSADYDMCTPCITNKRHEHPASHEFFTIEQPGHVIVHTVFSGESDSRRSHTRRTPARRSPGAQAPNQGSTSPAVHHALCDLCDSRIRGDRYVSHSSTVRPV
jgi:hypothetical protein